MKFINVTNSHSRMVMEQLANTDAELVKVYTAGTITIVYTVAPRHTELAIINKTRAIKANEQQEILDYFSKKIDVTRYDTEHYLIEESPKLVEISYPAKNKATV